MNNASDGVRDSHSIENGTAGIMSLSSTASSVASTSKSIMYAKLIQDFKNTIGKREIPASLIKLSRALILTLLLTITISIVAFTIQTRYLTETN